MLGNTLGEEQPHISYTSCEFEISGTEFFARQQNALFLIKELVCETARDIWW